MTPQPPKHNPEQITDRCMAATEADGIPTPLSGAHDARVGSSTEGQRAGSVSQSQRPFPVSLIRRRTNGSVTNQTWRRFLPGRALRNKKAVRNKAKESLDSPTRTPNSHQVTQESSRLGTLQLGKYAHEEEMPAWLIRLLETKGGLRADGVIPALEQLLGLSTRTEYAYLCHPGVQHVAKLRREGGFCGYRNIQVLSSHIIGTHMTGWEQLGDEIPSIFQIQDLIETAWDLGYNARGRAETGGIKGTRKYIGTPEAQAFFKSMGFPCSVQAFRAANEEDNAASRLLSAIEHYFQQGAIDYTTGKVRPTLLPPIYLQRPNHSITIVGLEKQKGGDIQLLVFDPEFQGSDTVARLASKATASRQSKVNKLLEPYRRSAAHLERFKEFEVLYLISDLAGLL